MIYRDKSVIKVNSILRARGLRSPYNRIYPIELKETEKFHIKIEVRGNGYKIDINSSKEVVNYEDPLVPPWAADWLTVFNFYLCKILIHSTYHTYIE